MSSLGFGMILALRTLLFGMGFLITTLIVYINGQNDAMIIASPWWPVYGLLANILCFMILEKLIKKEKTNLWSLINFKPDKLKKDILIGMVYIILSVVISVSSSILFGYLLYGRFPNELMLSFKGIPIFILISVLVIFPVVNSVTEEITYNGFIFPRLEQKVNSTFTAIILVLFFFTIQHLFITFKPDIKYLIWRLLSFIPLLLLWITIYIKMRRLTALILIHWFMDTFAILSIIFGTD